MTWEGNNALRGPHRSTLTMQATQSIAAGTHRGCSPFRQSVRHLMVIAYAVAG